jgi:predicted transcriptional regulator
MVSEIDRIFSKYVENYISDNLGPDMIRKIKNRLAEKGYTLTEAVTLFYPFHATLKEFFADGANGMLQKIFRSIFLPKKNTKNTIVIKDKNFVNLILSTYGDKDKQSILQAIADSTLSISEILDRVDIPKSSAYKIINSLVDAGILTISDQKIKNPDGNKALAYKTVLSYVDIKIKNAVIEIEVRFPEKSIQQSHILALSLGTKYK